VDPIPDPMLLKKSGSAGNRTLTSTQAVNRNGYQESSRGVRAAAAYARTHSL
jgi:hypothetical protein